MKCYACGKLVSLAMCSHRDPTNRYKGHISRDCTAPNGGPLNAAGKTCYKCGQPGHISKDCTSTEVGGESCDLVRSEHELTLTAPADVADIAAVPTATVA